MDKGQDSGTATRRGGDQQGADRRGLLIIWHSRTGGAAAMAQAALAGAREFAPEIPARLIGAGDAQAKDVIAAGALLFVCPENLAAMTGMMKEFFDRTYYPVLAREDAVAGLPYATAIAAGSDGEGATRQIDRIATGWRLRRLAEPLICNFHAQSPDEILAPKTLTEPDRKRCKELGGGLAAYLALGEIG